MSNSFIYYLKIHIDWITLWIGCCTGDEPHTTPADCSDKPKLDCSDLADGYYPDEYNCRCMEHLLLHWINLLSHLWTVLPFQEVLALRWGPRSTCSVSFKEPRPWRGRSSVQRWGSDVWLGWSCRLWRSVTNHLMIFKTESHLKFMCYRCKNMLVIGWSVTNVTRTATQMEVTKPMTQIFWNMRLI